VDDRGGREIYQPLARELAAERRLLEEEARTGQLAAGSEPDTHLLDVAAHWMEIRSGREDVLHK